MDSYLDLYLDSWQNQVETFLTKVFGKTQLDDWFAKIEKKYPGGEHHYTILYAYITNVYDPQNNMWNQVKLLLDRALIDKENFLLQTRVTPGEVMPLIIKVTKQVSGETLSTPKLENLVGRMNETIDINIRYSEIDIFAFVFQLSFFFQI